jgi:hypothetical protein
MAIFNYLRELTQITAQTKQQKALAHENESNLAPTQTSPHHRPENFRSPARPISAFLFALSSIKTSLSTYIAMTVLKFQLSIKHCQQLTPPSLLLITACHTVHWQV